MLTDPEAAELGLSGEGTAADAAGLEFLRLPTPDLQTPDPVALWELAGELCARLSGGGVAVHCRAGIGRSSVVAATVLVREGVEARVAWDRVAVARGYAVPDTTAQRDVVSGFEAVRPV